MINADDVQSCTPRVVIQIDLENSISSIHETINETITLEKFLTMLFNRKALEVLKS